MDELFSIFNSLCRKSDYLLETRAEDKLRKHFNQVLLTKETSFGNGRYVRNLFEKAVEKQANRIATLPNLDRLTLSTIEQEDIP